MTINQFKLQGFFLEEGGWGVHAKNDINDNSLLKKTIFIRMSSFYCNHYKVIQV